MNKLSDHEQCSISPKTFINVVNYLTDSGFDGSLLFVLVCFAVIVHHAGDQTDETVALSQRRIWLAEIF